MDGEGCGGSGDLTYIEKLREVIHHLHGVEARHVESVPIKEVYQGKTIWEGVVEVFDITGHPTAPRVYAWAHDTDDPKHPRRHVTVLHIPPVVTPLLAVRAALVQEARDARTQKQEGG
jgi:hypothetical protein